MRAVILAGGRGTRLAPYTVAFPKPLMPLGDIPILEVVVRQLRHYGFHRITLAVGHLAELLRAFFGDGSRFGVAIDYSLEEGPLGTAGPLRLIPDLEDDFLVMNGDLLTDLDYGALLGEHRKQGNAATIGTYAREVRIDLGVIETASDGRIVEYREKPILPYTVSMGVYALSRRVLTLLPEGAFDVPDLLRELMRRGERVMSFPFAGHWLDIGRQDDYARAQETFEAQRSRFLPDEAGGPARTR
ncbi:MAG: sugar phosphate nucleotidyltransferase [Deltaproteobacteria bacterium]|nr:sugar phosphate nucleotidyltransferase [Deltaproteobacteria bacterium]